ncbi:uncharacterized protein METZ01_LOCUS285808 [marine metagenome]|uniref:Uncharacterized protein n=1 Tax=marine metagenome TaxID=408172 RepID=A0A382L7P4_9ZZZZ
MLDIKKLENICAIIIIVAFFLPWVSLGFISFSGYDLPNLASFVNSFDAAFSENGESSGSANSLYAVYLIPLLSISILFMEYLGKESKKLCLTAGTLNVVGFLYILIFETEGDIGMMGIGIWITVLASIVMLLAATGFLKINSKT